MDFSTRKQTIGKSIRKVQDSLLGGTNTWPRSRNKPSWFDSHETFWMFWSDDTKSCTVSGPPSRKKRVVTCHAGSSQAFVENSHCDKSVQIRSFFWSVFSWIRSRKNSLFGHFSPSVSFTLWEKSFRVICRLGTLMIWMELYLRIGLRTRSFRICSRKGK